MNRYGLTKEEKKTHLQQYNHALFQNSLSFLDIVWEINLLFGTVIVLEDKTCPDSNRTEFSYEPFFQNYADTRISPSDLGLFQSHMSLHQLERLKEEDHFFIHLRSTEEKFQLYRVVLTPAFDEKGVLVCVYLGALNLHEEEDREPAQISQQEPFRDALLSGSYFHFELDVTTGGLLRDNFEARDGTYPIRDATGLEGPVPYSVWIEKWYELCQPQFSGYRGTNIFTLDYFRRAYERNERFIDVEVKQKALRETAPEYIHILVVLTENPANRHLMACIIWREVSPLRSQILESRLGPQKSDGEAPPVVSRDEQFLHASLSGALMIYNINLTQNLIQDEFYEIVDGASYPMLQLVGLTAPCNFDEFCKRWSTTKVPEDSRNTFLKLYNRQYLLGAYARGEYQLEIEFDTSIGRGIPVTLRNTILLTRDSKSGDIVAMVSGMDVTAQRRDEREKRKALQAAYDAANRANSAKSEFLARMSHDIRTPMNAIVGMTAIASAHLDDKERVQDCLSKITISSKHLLGLINDVLDMSKIESGKVRLQEEEFVLPDLVESLLTMCKPQIKAKGHELSVSIRDIKNEKVIGDSQHIQQAFMNLMSNAIKYTPYGGKISLSITEKPTNRPNIGCYEFVFEDNGIGMDEEFQKHLFNPFERATDDRTQKEQGTGLGMAITKNIVQMMNGTIEVESQLNKGTKFTVTIFLKLQEDSEEAYKKFLDLPVLVADDEESACELACAMLSELGMKGEWALTGQEAVERIVDRHRRGDDYYAVILDWKMPGMDGLATAKEIRRQAGDSIPIIILSAYDWSDIEQEARTVGVNAFISKPLFKSRMAYLFSELDGRNDKAEQRSSLEELEEYDFSGRRALLAEDNDINAEIAAEILGMIGIEVERAKNGKEALDAISRAEDGYYDIVFMDIQMPIMDGYEAVRAIRAIGRDYTSRVPILAMSANAFAEDVQEAKASGMNDHIAKPLDFEQLKQLLLRWIQ